MMKRSLPLLAGVVPVLVAILSSMGGCTVTTSSSSSGGTDGGASSSSSSSSSSGGGDAGGGGCEFGEPNNTREQSTSIALGSPYTEICAKTGDLDYYEIVAPNDAAGGVIKADFTNVGATGNLNIKIFSVTDNGEMYNHYGSANGQSQSVWFSAAPGQKYRIEVSTFGASDENAYKYDMKVSYTKIDDPSEPNQTKDEAKPLTKGVATEAILSSGLKGARPVDTDIDDYFSVDLVPGKASVRLENVPADLNAQWFVIDPTGKVVTNKYGGNDGASVINDEVQIEVAGKHIIRVNAFHAPEVVGADAVPASYTQKYKLTVAQP